jgi:hypothetical protein
MKTTRSVLLGILIGAGGMMLHGQNERAMHPRISAAIVALQDAISYMEKAPHDFGGHRVDAIRSSRAALRDLNEALRYRAREDRRN